MLFIHWRRVFHPLFIVLFTFALDVVNASHSHHAHHHHHRDLQTDLHLSANTTVTQSPTAPSENFPIIGSPDIDISSFIDNLVLNWTRTDPKFNASKTELDKLFSLASQLKSAVLNPEKRSTETAEAVRSPATQSSYFRRGVTNSTVTSNSTLESARDLVRKAQEEANARNVERLNNPRLNVYYTSNSTKHAHKRKRAMEADLLQINATVAAAAALVAEADAGHADEELTAGQKYVLGQKQKRGLEKRATRFWMENIEHTGRFPYGGESNYKVYRNVKDYGAVGDGKTDDTAAINRAMQDGSRCGENCGSSTVKGAIVYFPPGTYLISSTIESYYNTQMVGDANDLPVLLAAPSFVGLGVVSSDKYVDQAAGGQWYINQSNFLRQMRNFVIDITRANMKDIAGLHWQVAQATSVQNVVFFQSNDKEKGHIGIFAENGSGGFMSDLNFIGGAIGIRCGNQQFTTRNFVFASVRIAIDMLWDWGWTWKSLSIVGSDIGIKVSGDFMGGSILVVDSFFADTILGIGVTTPKGSTDEQHFTINIVNTAFSNTPTAVK
ncbi:hypothetical protein VTL71DRAFT_9478 [Oculimacula yallundae]|uniref:Rhamnogalacturonase A/B/Epimerase-like pectate lyase domain-containing protein n=1 Tax=Oculimacula yallundae TaxID=86028 RepID=A0ABR4BS02_9HELO